MLRSFWERSESTTYECRIGMLGCAQIMSFCLWVTWLDKTFSSLLNFLPKTWELANWSQPRSFSPSRVNPRKCLGTQSLIQFLGELLDSLSSVLVTKQSLSPDCLKSSCNPSALHKALNSSSLFSDILHPNKETRASAQKSTCFDSLLLGMHRKSSKYTDHMRWRRVDPNLPLWKRDSKKKLSTRKAGHTVWRSSLKSSWGHILPSKSRDERLRQTKGPVYKHLTSPNTWQPNHPPSSRSRFSSKRQAWKLCGLWYVWWRLRSG